MSDQAVDPAPAAAEGDAAAPAAAEAGQKADSAADGTVTKTDGSAAPDSAGQLTGPTDSAASGDGAASKAASDSSDKAQPAAAAEKPTASDGGETDKPAQKEGDKPSETVTAPVADKEKEGKVSEKTDTPAADGVDGKPASAAEKTTPSATEAVVVCGVNISEVTDQDKLHEMLEQCDNFDERKKIRARLMVLMQEAKARREQVQRRRLQHQQQRDGGSVSAHEAKMINDWLADNFDSDGNDSSAEAKMSSTSSSVVTKTSTSQSVTSSRSSQLSKGKAPVSAFDKFKQLDSANPKPIPKTDSASSDGGFKLDAGLAAKAQGAKEMTLYWAQCRTRDYQNVKIDNFSTSWNDGMAFCALIHHFYPDAFDFEKLNPKNRRYNFDLAFKTADERAGIYPLLDTDDMVAMRKPDWKCVFTYVQAIYRRLKDGPVTPSA